MIKQVTRQIWYDIVIMLSIAGVTFVGLSYMQSTIPHDDVIHNGTINPNATLDQVIQHINQTSFETDIGGIGLVDQADLVQNEQEIDLELQLGELIKTIDTHNVADTDYTTKLAQLCRTYQKACDIVMLDGSYTAKQQFAYQLMVVYVISKLENFGYDPLLTLQSITINNYTKSKRGYANAKLIVLNTYQMANYKEFLQVLVHEMGHVIDLGAISGSSSIINPDYTEFGTAKFAVDDMSLAFYALSWSNEDTLRSRMTNQDFVSGYGMSNPFEDFAECHNMYLYHRDVFAYMANNSPTLQQKYEYFDRLFKTRKLSANFTPTDLATLDVDFRPWDSTRM